MTDNAGKPTTSFAIRVPTLDVKENPGNVSLASSTEPQPFCPQSKVPQPGFISVVNAPKDVDADKLGSVTIGVSPQD